MVFWCTSKPRMGAFYSLIILVQEEKEGEEKLAALWDPHFSFLRTLLKVFLSTFLKAFLSESL